MTVVPRQSTTTSADAAPVGVAAPSAAIRPFSTRIASALPRGAARTPGATAPMFTRPRLPTPAVLAEAAVHDGLRRLPVAGLAHAPVHHGLRGRVEHLGMERAPADLGADEVPEQRHE